MRAAVLYGPGDVRVEDLPPPEQPEGWALVRSRAVGICGTDKAFYRGTYPLFKKPLVPGHEVSGEVVEGPEDLVGSRVVSEINFACLRCEVCREGLYTHCPRKKTLGIDFDGGMAEYFTAPPWALHPHNMPHEKAFAAEPLAAVLNALQQAPPRPGWAVAVLGTGFMAHLTAQTLTAYGFKPAIVARPDSPKAVFFRRLGLEVLTPEEAVKAASETPGGLGFHMVFETTGSNQGLSIATALARPRGVVHVKSTPGGEAVFSQTLAVVKEIRLIGTRCGSHREFKEALRLLESGEVEPQVTKFRSLEEAPEAFEASLDRESMKIVVTI
ncbi:putative zinc-binding dehydrogenase [Aeropyrum pernix K1]|uniref:Zinc-binding dehydrogenase n=1 Tax=Aeropyrum pernix (strain ATCC 700893 / DSM 11879 / JCM 9820 / NBRC 100138 / K1) TaxID=272557 RepID=Q9YCL2_AERPE|nr:putative zinc-binding dehydrogenase [Aeropyrum pernix K1]